MDAFWYDFKHFLNIDSLLCEARMGMFADKTLITCSLYLFWKPLNYFKANWDFKYFSSKTNNSKKYSVKQETFNSNFRHTWFADRGEPSLIKSHCAISLIIKIDILHIMTKLRCMVITENHLRSSLWLQQIKQQ